MRRFSLCRDGDKFATGISLGTVFRIKHKEYGLMDYETFFQSLFSLLKSGDNAYYVLYAVATCLLTQVFKKLFVNKVKVDIMHKFDFACVLPFIFGGVFSVIDVFAVGRVTYLDFDVIVRLAVSCAAIGALATVIFRFCSSLGGKSLKAMMKDDAFGIFYTQLLYFGNVREKLEAKELSLRDFISQVKLVSSNAMDIYLGVEDENAKRVKLAELLNGIVDERSISTCVNALNQALTRLAECRAKKAAKKTDNDG